MSPLYKYLPLSMFQLVQATFVAEEWVDHALGETCDADAKKEAAEMAQARAEKKTPCSSRPRWRSPGKT